MTRKLLLIDDDRDLAQLLTDFVGRQGYELLWADRPSAGFTRLEDRPDLILLDVMLPEMDGFAVCTELRSRGVATPIIMLTARGDDMDRIQGLRLGADDYLPKPFNPLELLARVEAVLRRVPPEERPENGLDADTRALRLEGREVPLTPTEYKLLEAMTASPGRAFTRDQLLDLLDEAGAVEAFDRAIDIHISRLRAKVEEDPKQPRHLQTVRGVGYRFTW
jgi:DNA-binding response OmpR family regulator